MSRITTADLHGVLATLTLEFGLDLWVNRANGGYRITDRTGSWNYSPRGTLRETFNFAQGMLKGCQLQRKLLVANGWL